MLAWMQDLLLVLLDASLRTVVLVAGAGAVLALARARASGVRHATWTAVLCTMLLMPVLPYWIPSISIPVPVPAAVPTVQNLVQRLPLLTVSTHDSQPILPAPVAQSSQPANPSARKTHAPLWPLWIAGAYCFPLLFLGIRLWIGWVGMRRLFQDSTHVRLGGNAPIYECASVASPVTVGVLRRTILLPASWRSWPKSKLRAILAHEIAHVRRHDPLIAFLARLNCCFFWFHPLSWWLERRLAVTAEQACDDAAVHRTGHARRYAEILLDTAEAVHRRGRRLSWRGVGVYGNGLLGERIDRILRGNAPALSRTRKKLISACCAVLILLVVACGKSRPPIEEEILALKRVTAARQTANATIYSEQVREQRLAKLSEDIKDLTPADAAELERSVGQNPLDVQSRLKLLAYYSQFAFAKTDRIAEIVAARRKHILWLIEFRPEDNFHRSPLAFINVVPVDPLADPDGYAEGRKLWLAQTKHPTANVLSNAAYFLEVSDKQLAEGMLLRLQTIQPLGTWTNRLARLYASSILGVTAVRAHVYDAYGSFYPLANSAAEAHSPYANATRKTLETETNDELLTEVARLLGVGRRRDLNLDFDPAALGKHYLERAAALNPGSPAVDDLARMAQGDRQARIRKLPVAGRYEAAMTLPDRDRFELFWDLARYPYYYGNSFDADHSSDALQQWEEAGKYAAGLLEAASKFSNDSAYGTANFNGNVMMGFVAAENHDNASALQFLREASKAPGRLHGTLRANPPWLRLCSALIDDGHLDDVIAFLDHFAQMDPVQHDQLLAAAAQLRSGIMPDWYRRPTS
jgi:beta-lactamase regulating signal transducer with metallopeptidase domain